MAVRRRLRSLVHRLAMGTINVALEGLEDLENSVQGFFEDVPEDDEDDLLDPIADELDDEDEDEDLLDEEAYLDAVEEIEGDLAELNLDLDAALGSHGTVLPFPIDDAHIPSHGLEGQLRRGDRQSTRALAIPLLDAETGEPVLQLFGKKNKFGRSRKLVINNDKIPTWATLKMLGLQVHVHGWRSEEEATPVPADKDRIYLFREEDLGKGEKGLESGVVMDLVDRDCPRSVIAKRLAEFLEMDIGDITDRHIKLARSGPPQDNTTRSIPLYARDLRLDDGGNLLPQQGWNPVTLAGGDPMALREHPLLEHVEIGDRVSVKVALGPLGEKRKDALYCSVCMLVSIEADTVMDLAGMSTGR